jgi:hypothetical protein
VSAQTPKTSIGRALRASLALMATLSMAGVALALNGQIGVEFAVDAPWRIEPTVGPDGSLTYAAIPIVIEFADANFEADRGSLGSLAYPQIFIGSLKGLRIREYAEDQPDVIAATTFIPASEFQEIERKIPMSTKNSEPSHELCRPIEGQDCSGILDITKAHEFHAAAWYRPKLPVTPGRNILLQVSAITERTTPGLPEEGTDDNWSLEDAGDEESPRTQTTQREFINYVAVHAGDAPLPRFGNDWLYGDFHYHSQGTDNDGESGYSYRNVVRALGATGMDFVFATDHASDGVQAATGGEARDLNVHRFASAKRIIYGPDGANEAIKREAAAAGFARVAQGGVWPQIYMGEEVDSWPEISAEEYADRVIYYGDHLTYPWAKVGDCEEETDTAPCQSTYAKPSGVRNSYQVYDQQGIPLRPETHPTRQHIVYFPASTSDNAAGFVSSSTGPYGGASKRLPQVISEIERGGVAFLAHPLEESSPGGPIGPDIVPYSDLQLTDAWRSEAILGLEFWNENTRTESRSEDADEVMDRETENTFAPLSDTHRISRYHFKWPFHKHRINAPKWSWETFNLVQGTAKHLYQGAVTWDRYLRKGVDRQQTSTVSWLRRGEPRKWFMSGGSDAHGDFNYRRAGRMGCGTLKLGRWCDDKLNDTAIGNPRNLISMTGRRTGAVVAPEAGVAGTGPKQYANRQVIDAIRTGNFSVADGPVVRVLVDQNRNGIVEDTDFPMGSVVDFYPGEYIPILVEWISTPEFGPVAQVDLYVGNKHATFAVEDHGPVIVADYPGANKKLGAYSADTSGALQVKLADNNGVFNRPGLDPKIRYHGVARIFVAPGQFQLAESEGELFYVRAFAKTIRPINDWFHDRNCKKYSGEGGNKCGDRFAYANPVWGRYHKTCPEPPRGARPPDAIIALKPPAYLDSNNNLYPDVCESVILDACMAHPETGSPDHDAPLAEGTATPEGRPGNAAGVAVPESEIAGIATDETVPNPDVKPTPMKSCQMLRAPS